MSAQDTGMSGSDDTERVLSIQSHVVSGYVGNRAATFPLQTLGFDVDVINSVQFSNHTGYGLARGHKTTAEELRAIFEGLDANGLSRYSRVITGYIPGAEALQVVADRIEAMRAANPDLVYLLDPVMGDVGRGLYVSPDVVPVYRRMLRLATIITPNQFETELLSGVRIDSIDSLKAALLELHTASGVPHVVCSSVPFKVAAVAGIALPEAPNEYQKLLPETIPPWYKSLDWSAPDSEVLLSVASTWDGQHLNTWLFALPTLDADFTGTGDLLSAMIMGHFQSESSPGSDGALYSAVSRALLVVQQILLRTHLYSTSLPRPPSGQSLDNDPAADVPRNQRLKGERLRQRELRLIPERHLIAGTQAGWPGVRLNWQT